VCKVYISGKEIILSRNFIYFKTFAFIV